MSKFAPHRRSANNPRATSSTVCQKCLQRGHFTYECKSTTRPYLSRPSRTQLLEHPSRLSQAKAEGKPSVEVPEEFLRKSGTANKILEGIEKKRKEEQEPDKKRARKDSTSSSSSSDSDSDSDSDSSSDSSSSDSSSSRSSSRSRNRRVPRRRSSTPPTSRRPPPRRSPSP